MPYEKMVVHEVDGTTETFSCRIGVRGFQQWLEERDDLVAQGFPDRPPDVEGRTLRTWLPHPGEEALPFFADGGYKPELQAVWVGSWHAEDRHVVIKVYADDDGSVTVHIETYRPGRDGERIERKYAADLESERVWLAIEDDIIRVNEEEGWRPGDPMVTLPSDFAMFEAELALAEADIARGFINPLPDQRFLS